jgi:hypothetical protein
MYAKDMEQYLEKKHDLSLKNKTKIMRYTQADREELAV